MAESPRRTPPPSQARRRARLRALQALYQHEFNPQPSRHLVEQFMATQDMAGTDVDYFSELLKQVITGTGALDEALAPYLDIPVKRLDPTERCILRLAVYELLHRPDIPYRVVINEAVGLAKKFGAADGHKFVNGVLDKAVVELRAAERGSLE